MRTVIRKIGNSRGIIIPSALLAEAELKEEVELTLKGKSLIIEPVDPAPRQGWFEGYDEQEDIDAWADYVAETDETEEWMW